MENKHTPGPWEWHGQVLWEKLADDVRGDAVGEARISNEYDQCLIAAAPELLEALEGLVEEIDDCAQPSDWDFYEPARTAIAKARGQS